MKKSSKFSKGNGTIRAGGDSKGYLGHYRNADNLKRGHNVGAPSGMVKMPKMPGGAATKMRRTAVPSSSIKQGKKGGASTDVMQVPTTKSQSVKQGLKSAVQGVDSARQSVASAVRGVPQRAMRSPSPSAGAILGGNLDPTQARVPSQLRPRPTSTPTGLRL